MVVVTKLERDRLVHQITPSSVSLHEVVATDLVLVTTGTENVGSGTVTVITIRLVTVSVLRILVVFQSPDVAGTVSAVDKGAVNDGTPVPENDEGSGGKPSKVLLRTGAEYGGGGA